MAAVITTSMEVLLPLIEARLTYITELPAERILPWVGDEPPHLQGDHDLVLKLGGIVPDTGWYVGGGRTSFRVTETLEVQIRTRLILDPTGVSRAWLTHATLGHVQLRKLVLDALVGYIPHDGDGNALIAEGLVPKTTQRPRPDTRGAVVNWGSETLAFEMNYLHTLNTALSLSATED